MNMSELFLDGAQRAARKEIQDAGLATAMWATVQSVNPVRVALDKGDGTPMRISPKSLVGGLVVGDRVWVEIAGNRAVIIGATCTAPPVPPGMIAPFAGGTSPGGWLLCQGQAVSRTGYADLFAVIGTTYGAGDGSTTFNVPNLQGRVPVGLQTSDADFSTLGKTGGAKTHTLTTAQIPAHQHIMDQNGGNVGYAEGSTNLRYSVSYANTRASANITTGNTGGGAAHPNVQPYITLNYIVKT